MSVLPSRLSSLLSELHSAASETTLQSCISNTLSSCPLSDLLQCSTQCLNLFVQLNWTGPPNEGVESSLETLVGKDGLCSLNKSALSALSSDGEAVYELCTLPLLLHIARLLLVSPGWQREGQSLLVKRWAMRCVFVQQQLLDTPSSSLWQDLSKLLTDIEELVETSSLSQEDQAELYLELGHVSLYYMQYGSAKVYFEHALQVAGVSTELTGVLGRRTRFQQTDVAQLVLKVSSSPTSSPAAEGEGGGAGPGEFPREVCLDDDTVLDKISFTQPPSVYTLTPLQQAVLLGWSLYQKKTKAVDHFSAEEMEAYLNCVLRVAQCWVVQGHALFLRTQLEKQRYRVQQRNMQQLEELVESFQHTVPEVCVRLKLFYCTFSSPVWVLQRELASVLVKLGCLSSAVEVLTRLQMWEELAMCYQAVGRKAKARELVQQQLDASPTPSLLCLMGDITQDAGYYSQAWEVSGKRSSRAQRSLGLWHLKREEYEDSVECLQKSLQVNSLQEGVWFSLGCAASKVGNVDLAITAWHREVTLQPDFAEAWNNLGGAYLQKEEKRRAHKIFNEALRCSYDNAKIWENYLVVSAELCLWGESLKAYQRLLDLHDKFLDVQVLTVLVGGVTQGFPERGVAPGCEFRAGLGELLGRICSRGQVPASVWRLCAEYHLSSTHPQDHLKGVEEWQKAQRVARQQVGWDRSVKGVTGVGHLTLEYCRACRKLYGTGSGEADKKQALAGLSSAKLALQGVISKTKGFGLVRVEAVEELLEELEAELLLLTQTISLL